jgi:hypothetical protein
MKKHHSTGRGLKLTYKEIREHIVAPTESVEEMLDRMEQKRTNRQLRREHFMRRREGNDEENYFDL